MQDQGLANGYGATTLPDGLEKKYPNTNKECVQIEDPKIYWNPNESLNPTFPH
jgi:hypothetical protein